MALYLLPLALLLWMAAICIATRYQQRYERNFIAHGDPHPHHAPARPGRLATLENEPLKPTVPLALEAEWKFGTGEGFIPDRG